MNSINVVLVGMLAVAAGVGGYFAYKVSGRGSVGLLGSVVGVGALVGYGILKNKSAASKAIAVQSEHDACVRTFCLNNPTLCKDGFINRTVAGAAPCPWLPSSVDGIRGIYA